MNEADKPVNVNPLVRSNSMGKEKIPAKAAKADLPVQFSEAEVLELIQDATQQYEEYMKLADFASYSEAPEVSYPSYSWANPIGLVVEGT